MENGDKIILLDLSSATTGVFTHVDNTSDHAYNSSGNAYRVTNKSHVEESNFTLGRKVDQVAPDLFDSKKGLATVYLEVKTPYCTTAMTVERLDNNLAVTLVGGAGTITIPLERSLTQPNHYHAFADLMRAVVITAGSLSGLKAQPASVEDKGFKKLYEQLRKL